MPRYQVVIAQTVSKEWEIVVTAENQETAEQIAMERVFPTKLETRRDEPPLEFTTEPMDNPEVLECLQID